MRGAAMQAFQVGWIEARNPARRLRRRASITGFRKLDPAYRTEIWAMGDLGNLAMFASCERTVQAGSSPE